MLRADFEGHRVWELLETISKRLGEIRHVAAVQEIAILDTIGFYRDHLWSYREAAGVTAPFFVDAMLSPAVGTLDNVASYLDNRISAGTPDTNFLEMAREQIESVLVVAGAWPKPYAKGAQVQQMNTLYEELLERQRQDLQTLERIHSELRDEMAQFQSSIAASAQTASGEISALSATANDAASSVTGGKAQIDDLIAAGVKQVADLPGELTAQQKAWQKTQEGRFEALVQPFLQRLEEHQNTAGASLARLLETESQHANLTAASATDKLAGHFAAEAKTSRTAGTTLYIVGALFIVAAATPLLFLLSPSNFADTPDGRWEQLVVRLAIGAAAGAAATVAIRVGGRFFASANVAKRMELDLRTFGPFLANVDATEVDKARISLVERALGRSQGDSKQSEDTLSIGGWTQVVDVITKYLGRSS